MPIKAVGHGLEADRGAAPKQTHDAPIAIGGALNQLDHALAQREHGVGVLALAVQNGLPRKEGRANGRKEMVKIGTAQRGEQPLTAKPALAAVGHARPARFRMQAARRDRDGCVRRIARAVGHAQLA